jgi:phosphopantetheine--protein transferase-like protein
MPFVKKIEVENGILGIWELTESIDSLIADFQFSENEENEFKRFLLKKRQSEYLAIRLLLQQMLNEKSEITYLKSGRPQIKNSSLNISISHSTDLVVIFISESQVGIDVENIKRNIQSVAKRFLHSKELEWIEKSENIQDLMILYWGAKEAVYKCCNQSGVQFDTQIYIPQFEFGKTNFFNGKLTTQNRHENYNLWYLYFRNNIIVYCVEVKNNS